MYENYGDRNFFEYGMLVDTEHSDSEIDILYCMPYSDEDDLYQYAHLTVDIDDGWIDKDKVMENCGMAIDTFDPARFAVACVDYYGPEEFGAYDSNPMYDWSRMTKEDIKKDLEGYMIDREGLSLE